VVPPPDQGSERELVLAGIQSGEIHILIGEIFQVFAFDKLPGLRIESFRSEKGL
jgi:hypothetical protein